MGDSSEKLGKDGEEPQVEAKMILCSAKDEFVLCQDLCVMCGSLGKGDEGRLIACSQCGQGYHPYCVNIKTNKVVLNKGWRCLDCTVCEGCGQPTDESRLLLCDECDISYHTYCLQPPLDEVPHGTWKCHNCVACVKCSSTDPGTGSLWQKNYTECGPCASQSTCPACVSDYQESDLIIECVNCNRWFHSRCDGMMNEDDCELAADYGYNCLMCRGKDEAPPHILARKLLLAKMQPSALGRDNSLNIDEQKKTTDSLSRRVSIEQPSNGQQQSGSSPEDRKTPIRNLTGGQGPICQPPVAPLAAATAIPAKVNKFQFTLDGVMLSENGLNMIKSLSIEQPKRQRAKKGTKIGMSSARGDDQEEAPKDDDASIDIDKTEENKPEDGSEKKKRQRRLDKLGIGGFAVKQRGRLSKDDDTIEIAIFETNNNNTEGVADANKPKRKRRIKKKTQLTDTFPSYMQEAFFGKNLLDNSKEPIVGQVGKLPLGSLSDDECLEKISSDKIIILNTSDLGISGGKSDIRKSLDETSTQGPFDDELDYSDDLRDLLPLPQDDELMDILMNDGEALNTKESLDVMASDVDKDDAKDSIDPFPLSPSFNLDTIVGDTGLPHMDGKDVEDIFKGVLSPTSCDGDSTDFLVDKPLNSLSSLIINPGNQSLGIQSKLPSQSSLAGSLTSAMVRPPQIPLQSFSQHSPSIAMPIQPGIFSSVTASHFNQELPSMPNTPGLQATEQYAPQWPVENDNEPSQGQKNVQKWESDEAMGDKATISPVLYANLAFPNLKSEFPQWNDRVKQISKLWRQLSTDSRQPYLQKARENRAASRISKAQAEQSRSTISPGIQRIPPRIPETEQERQWKQLQTTRQQHQHPLTPDQIGPQMLKLQHPHEHPSPLPEHYENNNMLPFNSDSKPSLQSDMLYGPQPHQHQPNDTLVRQNWAHPAVPSEENHIQIRMPHMVHQRPPTAPMQIQEQIEPHMPIQRMRVPLEPLRMPPPGGHDSYAVPQGAPRPHPGQGPPRMIAQRSPFSPASPATPQTPISGEGPMFHTPPPRPRSSDQFSNQGQPIQGVQGGTPASPFMIQPKTPVPSSSSPFSPSQARPQASTPDPFNQAPNTPRPSSQPHPPALSPMAPFSPATSQDSRFSPAPRPTPSRSAEFSSPLLSESGQNSPFSKASPGSLQSLEFQPPQQSGSVPCSPSTPNTPDPYSQMPMTPRPQPNQLHMDMNDPYARMPMTPRPQDVRQPGLMRSKTHDQFVFPPGGPRAGYMQRGVATRQPMQQMHQDPYSQQPGTPMPEQQDPYAMQPRTPMPGFIKDESSDGSNNPGMARQQLRDLLQMRKQEQMPRPDGSWVEQQNRPRMPMMPSDGNRQQIRMPMQLQSSRMPNQDNFRTPFPPQMHPRQRMVHMQSGDQQVFRHPGESRMALQRPVDPRMRMQGPHQLPIRPQWLAGRIPIPPGQRMGGQMHPRDGLIQQYDHQQRAPGGHPSMMQQQQHPGHYIQQQGHPPGALTMGQLQRMHGPQQGHMHHMGPGGPVVSSCTVRGPMPHGPPMQAGVHPQHQLPIRMAQQQTAAPGEDVKPSTVELVKQLQETTAELPDPEVLMPEDLDDDELLGQFGNDFNILEYADPELDKALGGVGGSKNNILDEHFDDIEEAKKEKLRAEEAARNQSIGKPSSAAGAIPQVPISQANVPFNQNQDKGQLRPQPQPPPPPYPGQKPVQQVVVSSPLPPPPYPCDNKNDQVVHGSSVPSAEQEDSLSDIIPKVEPFTPKNEPTLLLDDYVDQENKENKITIEGPVQVEQFVTSGQGDALLSDFDFERLKADILSDDSLSGPPSQGMPQQGSPMQSPTGPPPMQSFGQLSSASHGWHDSPQGLPHMEMHMQRHQLQHQHIPPQSTMQHHYQQQSMVRMPVRHPMLPGSMQTRMGQIGMPQVHMPPPHLQGHPAMIGGQGARIAIKSPTAPPRFQIQTIPEPPQPPEKPATEHDFQLAHQYESWLKQQENLLADQQTYLMGELAKLRKIKKTLNAKQRQQRKNNLELNDQDCNELARATAELTSIMKSLDQVKRKSRQHNQCIQEYERTRNPNFNMIGNPPTANVHSPGIPPQVMNVHSRATHSPMVMPSGGPGTPGLSHLGPGTPGTPQSPALMSPSPMAPSPNPMIHSPATSLSHSPAHALPNSPMIQSPIYSQQQSPMTHMPSLVSGQDDSGTYGDGYQQKGLPPGPVRSQMQVNYPINQGNFDSQQMQGGNMQQFHSMRVQGPHGPQSQQMRYNINQGQMRPYGDVSGQQYPNQIGPGQGGGGKPPMIYHQQQVRRMPPPPPYPGQYQQQMFQQQQQQQQQQQMPHQQLQQMQHQQHVHQPQQVRYGPAQGVIGQPMPMRHNSPDHSHPIDHQHQQTIRMPFSSPLRDSPKQHEIVINPQNSMTPPQHQQSQHHHPQLHQQSQQQPQQQQQQLKSQLQQQQSHQQHLDYNQPQAELQLQHEFKQEDDGESCGMVVGEAKTSMTLNFHEKGSGEENDAVNENILEQNCDHTKEGSLPKQSTSNSLTITQIKQEPGVEPHTCQGSELGENSHDVVKLERNLSVNCSTEYLSETTMTKMAQGNGLSQYSLSQGESSDGMDSMDPTMIKQNVLLKQLLQNCPSADSLAAQAAAVAAAMAVAESQVSKPTAIQSTTETTATSVTATPVVTLPHVVIDAKPKDIVASEEIEVMPTAAVTVRSDAQSETTVIEINTDLSNHSSGFSFASPEKKLTYLDIRRAQLEREPTPPPEDPKPKRKRVIKKKEPKPEPPMGAMAVQSNNKKRARKASQTRPEEDYDLYLNGLMTQLRVLPPMLVHEPKIKPNFNMSIPFGSGDLNAQTSVIRGCYGQGFIPTADPEKALTPAVSHSNFAGSRINAPSSTMGLRGFYNQEFNKASRNQIFSLYHYLRKVSG